MRITRLYDRPIVTPDLHEDIADNINGPSLIRAPDWLPNRLGTYYLYFAHHQGTYIRLAYADDLAGPWTLYEGGTLQLDDTDFRHHIASPDVHVDHERQEILMFFHGCCRDYSPWQFSQLAASPDGLTFRPISDDLSASYWRGFNHGGWWYGLVMPGVFYRSREIRGPYEEGPTLFNEYMRHSAVRVVDDKLEIFYSTAYDCPECIQLATLDLSRDWQEWQIDGPTYVLRPERDYEGAQAPLVASRRGSVHEPANQLRDPCIFEDEGRTLLLYTVAGEWGIAIAEIDD